MKHAVIFVFLASILSACGSLTDKQHTFLGESHESLVSEKLPGISDLDTIDKHDRAEEKWWDGFYGNKSSSGE